MSVEAQRWQTKEGQERYDTARALAERCAAEVAPDYRLEETLEGYYPPSWDDLLAACGEDEAASQRYGELYDAVREARDDPETRAQDLWALETAAGERQAACVMAYALFGDALSERRQREQRQLTPEDLTRALLNTEGKFQSAQDRALAILKG